MGGGPEPGGEPEQGQSAGDPEPRVHDRQEPVPGASVDDVIESDDGAGVSTLNRHAHDEDEQYRDTQCEGHFRGVLCG